MITITIRAETLLDDCGDYCLCQRASIANLYVRAIRERLAFVADKDIDVAWYWDSNMRIAPWGVLGDTEEETVNAQEAMHAAWNDESWWPPPANEPGQTHEPCCREEQL